MQREMSLQDVRCVRGGRLLFAGLSLILRPGDALLVTGPNGAGKSSLLRLMAGLLAPIAGTLTVNGSIALADGRDALNSEETVVRALGFWARLDGVGDQRVAMALMGIAHLADVPVRMLSSGQRQRAALARLMGCGADIWLLDEPNNCLDAEGVAQLEAGCAAHRARGGIVIAATHLPLLLPGAQQVELAA